MKEEKHDIREGHFHVIQDNYERSRDELTVHGPDMHPAQRLLANQNLRILESLLYLAALQRTHKP